MADKTHKVVVVDNVNEKVLARLWWTGKKVETDNPSFIKFLENHGDNPWDMKSEGPDFLDYLPKQFRNGYLHAYRIGE